ncbi:MAG: hypothetical protein WCS01_10195, partial [bacterium]
IAFIAMGVWVAILFKSGVYIPTLAAAAAIGALLGFLFFNFPPATIFMGDSGSLPDDARNIARAGPQRFYGPDGAVLSEGDMSRGHPGTETGRVLNPPRKV